MVDKRLDSDVTAAIAAVAAVGGCSLTSMRIGGIALSVESCDGVMLSGIAGFAPDGGSGIGDNRRNRRRHLPGRQSARHTRIVGGGGLWG